MTEMESNTLVDIIKKYQDIHLELNGYEIRLNGNNNDPDVVSELGIKIRECIKSLDLNRDLEKIFIESLGKKYGPGEIDVKTLKYKLSDAISTDI